MTLKPGWTGRYFEDFEVGDVYRHPYGKTISEAENMWFSHITLNLNPLHFNADYAATTEFGRPVVDGILTLGVVVGMSVIDLSQNGFNLQLDEVIHHAPVFHGDTIYAQSEVLALRESRSRPGWGIVTVASEGYNQAGVKVISFKRTMMIKQRHQAE
ncbi:MAG: MaoC family dehydratase [Anaerolineae bacterium]|nr:MaoC family dehydratase [Anaerolineae bacterium]